MDRRMLIIPLVLTALLVLVTLGTDEADGESIKKIVVNGHNIEFDSDLFSVSCRSSDGNVKYKLNDIANNTTITSAGVLKLYASTKVGHCIPRLNGNVHSGSAVLLNGDGSSIIFSVEMCQHKIAFSAENADLVGATIDTFYLSELSAELYGEINLPEVPLALVKYGYESHCWNTEEDGSGIDFLPGTKTVTEDFLDTICRDCTNYKLTLYPKYIKKEYQILCEVNDGVRGNIVLCPSIKIDESINLSDHVIERDGSVFKYWTYRELRFYASDVFTLNKEMIKDTDEIIFSAQWHASIIPNLEHCTSTMDSEVVDYGTEWSTTIKPHDHYRLPSEISSVGASYVLNPNGTATLSTNSVSCPISFTITAIPIEHTVTFNSNGGSAVEDLTFNEIDTQTFQTPTNGIYEFNGWFNGDNKIENTAGLLNDITVVAKWTPVYNVNFYDDRGGALIKECTTKGSVTAPTDPTRSGYNFTGWSSSDGVFTGTVSKDTNYYAQWSAIYVPPTPTPVPTEPEPTVTFYLEEGGDVYMKCTSSELEELPTPTIEGYAFDYWYQRVDDEVLEEFTGEFDEDIDVYAHWTAIMNRYHLYEGGDTWYEGYVCFERPTRDGYEFDSWYIIRDDQKVQFTEGLDLDVYASWKEKAVPPSSDGKINLILPIVAISLIAVMILGFIIYQKRLK